MCANSSLGIVVPPVRVREHGPGRYALSGTPVDCVYVGMIELAPRLPDLVISGMAVSDGIANAKVVRQHVAETMDDSLSGLWTSLSDQSDVALPFIVVRSNVGRGQSVNNWRGSMDQAQKAGLLESPSKDRKRLGKLRLAKALISLYKTRSTARFNQERSLA